MEKQNSPINAIIDKIVSKEDGRKSLIDESGEDKGDTRGCLEGWLNYRNELCFYGVQTKGEFFFGREQCGQLNANFTSVHSDREFKFISDNFDLHDYWIGIVYGSPNFEDGTKVGTF